MKTEEKGREGERGRRALSSSPLAPELLRLVRDWLAHREAQALARGTRENDRTSLERFVGWIEAERRNLRSLPSIDRTVLEDYVVWLSLYEDDEGARLQAATRRRHLLSVVSFFRWLEKRGRVLASPARDLVLPKVTEKLPRGILSAKEMARVLAVPDLTSPFGLRDRAILEVVYSTGIRNAELRALRLDDLDLAEGFLTVRRGKGGKGRVVPIGRLALASLERYLEDARPLFKRSRFERLVFLSRIGSALQNDVLFRLLQKIGREAGLKKPLTCHGLRHTCATHLLRGRADVRHIQELLGHRSLSSTQIYTHVAATDLKRVHARCHPRERGGT